MGVGTSCRNLIAISILQSSQKRPKKTSQRLYFHYLDGGADDEWSLRRNTSAFDQWEIIPSTLNTRLFDRDIALPFFLSPTGMSQLFHHDKELAAARAAGKAGTFYVNFMASGSPPGLTLLALHE